MGASWEFFAYPEADYAAAHQLLLLEGHPTPDEVRETGERVLRSYWPGTFMRDVPVEVLSDVPMPAPAARAFAARSKIASHGRDLLGAVPLCPDTAWNVEDRAVSAMFDGPEIAPDYLGERALLAVRDRLGDDPDGTVTELVGDGPRAVRVYATARRWVRPTALPARTGWAFFGWVNG